MTGEGTTTKTKYIHTQHDEGLAILNSLAKKNIKCCARCCFIHLPDGENKKYPATEIERAFALGTDNLAILYCRMGYKGPGVSKFGLHAYSVVNRAFLLKERGPECFFLNYDDVEPDITFSQAEEIERRHRENFNKKKEMKISNRVTWIAALSALAGLGAAVAAIVQAIRDSGN
ncbi:MAG: hypothetical protein HN370_05880 [Phycisphaerales bacterium]|jgi:hypothetical protein|nr:hypothetical protein [Phycisphaerales bacterium]